VSNYGTAVQILPLELLGNNKLSSTNPNFMTSKIGEIKALFNISTLTARWYTATRQNMKENSVA
jgi:hypothetical protein